MKKLTASEAIGPAWEHAKVVMCVPFRWQRYLKLGFVALVAQMAAGGFSMSLNPGRLGRLLHSPDVGTGIAAISGAGMLLLGASITLLLVVGLGLFYIASRMQFVLFDVVATRESTIGPIWKKYGAKTWRWLGLKLMLGLGCIVVIGIVLVTTVPFFIGSIMQLFHADNNNVVGEVGAGLVLAILAFVLGGLLFALVLGIVLSLLHDFTLPYIAIEDLGIRAALTRLEHFIRESPGEVALYLLLKLALSIALGFLGELAMGLTMLVSTIPFAIVGVPLYFLLHGHGMGANIVLFLATIAGSTLLIVWAVVLCAAIFGYVYVFLQSYALYFMGGRYKLLGELLEPPIAPPAVPTTITT